jgi:hypothetical protein
MNKQKGDLYEKQVLDNLNLTSNYNLWLWKDIPEHILIEYGIIHDMNQHRLIKKQNKTQFDTYSSLFINKKFHFS